MNQFNDGFMKDSRKEKEPEVQAVPALVKGEFGLIPKTPLSPSNNLRERFGKILLRARKLRGLSQKQFAIEAEVDAGYVSRIENGHRDPPGPLIITRMAKVLQINNPEILMMAAGYLEFDPDAMQQPEDAVYQMIGNALGYSCKGSSVEHAGEVYTVSSTVPSVVPLMRQGDECLAVDASGKLITGKMMLYMETDTAEVRRVTCVLYRVG